MKSGNSAGGSVTLSPLETATLIGLDRPPSITPACTYRLSCAHAVDQGKEIDGALNVPLLYEAGGTAYSASV